MPQNLLTDAKVRNAKPQEAPYKLADGGGLFLLVRPNGARLWRWKFRLAGKEGLFAVGAFPALGLADARHARDAARALVAQGMNPAHQRGEERRANIANAEARRRDTDGAFGKVADAWLKTARRLGGRHLPAQAEPRDPVPDARLGCGADHADRPAGDSADP